MHCYTHGLGSSAFARHYLRNHCYFLFLRVMRCFSSPGSPLTSVRYCHCWQWVAPFGNPRFAGYLLLTMAYRSLSRPSSPSRAKASFMCPFLLSFYCRLQIHSYLFFELYKACSSFLLRASIFVFTSIAPRSVLDSFFFCSLIRPKNVSSLPICQCSLFLIVVPGRVELPTSTLSV